MPNFADSLRGVLPLSAEVAGDHLIIGGCDTVDLSEKFGTPLFVFCEKTFRQKAREFKQAFPSAGIYYAAKAFLCAPLCRMVEQEGLSLDVASGGELHTALAAGFPPERMIFHGNNKLDADIARSVGSGVGRIAIDNLEEVERIAKAAAAADRRQTVVVRVTPGVEAHTHEYIRTGQEDSKFGLSVQGGMARKAIERVLEEEHLDFAGIHAHIGSNILVAEPFAETIEILFEFAAEIKASLGRDLDELNLGGGFGISHSSEEDSTDLEELSAYLKQTVEREADRHGLAAPRLCFEPGRFLVGNSMVTLYRVGVIKHLEGIRTYVSVDGGMSDNIRPALYGAKYSALLANKASGPAAAELETFSLAGIHCESGDVLIKDVPLPASITKGDIVAVPATGAYTYSMASNYNKQPKPAVVAVEDGAARVLIRRETFDDLLRLEEHLD